MASLVLTDAFVSLSGNDVSAYVAQVNLSYMADVQEDTAMGDGSRSRIGGLKDWSVDIEFNQDFAAGLLDSILFPLVGTTFTVILRPVKATAVGTSNPNFSGTCIFADYKPLGGSVGDLAKASITLQGSGTLSRLTA